MPDNKLTFQEALANHKNGKVDQAMQLYRSVPENDKVFYPLAQSNLALLLHQKGEIKDALNTWSKALHSDPNCLDALVNKGIVLKSVGENAEAYRHLLQASNVAPDRSDISMHLAELLSIEGRHEQAIKLLLPLKAATPLLPNVWLLLAHAEGAMGKLPEAIAHLQELLSKIPDLPEALVNLAQIKSDQNEFTEAEKLYKKAVNTSPDNYFSNAGYGQFLNDQGRSSEALSYLEKACTINPQYWGTFVHLGNALKEVGKLESAIEAYKHALTINPNDLGTKQNLSRLLARFVPPWHLKMLADRDRNKAYEEAIAKVVNTDSVVLDIGTGSGLLSLMCSRHGAKKVYTCEQSKYISAVAEEIIGNNDERGVIQLFNKKSTALTSSELSPKPNILVAEIFDAGLIGEGVVPTFRHALQNLCATDCKVIPSGGRVIGQLLQIDELSTVNPVRSIEGFDLSAFDQFRIPSEYISEDLNKFKHQFLSPEFHLLTYDFSKLPDPIKADTFTAKDFKIKANKSGRIDGIAFWFELLLDDEITLSSSPKRLDNHWGQAIFFFEESLTVAAGSTISFQLRYNDSNIWFEKQKNL